VGVGRSLGIIKCEVLSIGEICVGGNKEGDKKG